jgi:hypothetical protein
LTIVFVIEQYDYAATGEAAIYLLKREKFVDNKK